MKSQTPDQDTEAVPNEEPITDEQLSERIRRINFWSNHHRLVKKRDRAIIKAAKKAEGRIVKPRPKRRLKSGFVITRLGGEPVEGIENEFQNIN